MSRINPARYKLAKSNSLIKGYVTLDEDKEEIQGDLVKALTKCKLELNVDKELALASGLKDFAMPGLYSIILSRNGPFKTRLFVFDGDHTKLGKLNLPIHKHKYIDILTPLFGLVKDHIYQESLDGDIAESFKYSRLCDTEQHELERNNSRIRLTLIKSYLNQAHCINCNELHTVTISENQTAWIIQEIDYNPEYDSESLCYLLASMNDLPKFKTAQMTEEDFIRVKVVLNNNGYHLNI